MRARERERERKKLDSLKSESCIALNVMKVLKRCATIFRLFQNQDKIKSVVAAIVHAS